MKKQKENSLGNITWSEIAKKKTYKIKGSIPPNYVKKPKLMVCTSVKVRFLDAVSILNQCYVL